MSYQQEDQIYDLKAEIAKLREENEELRKLVRQVWSWDREATWEELVSHYPILQHNS